MTGIPGGRRFCVHLLARRSRRFLRTTENLRSNIYLIPRYSFCSTQPNCSSAKLDSTDCSKNLATKLQNIYDRSALELETPFLADQIDRRAVFANNELNLGKIDAYGFDYDYTLAVYTIQLNKLIYDLAMERLINDSNYPYALRDEPYDIKFAIRGLHLDVNNCLLMKLDQFCCVQRGTTYRGKKPIADEELLSMYPRGYVPYSLIENRQKVSPAPFRQLADLFSLPEAGLIATVTDYFDRKNIKFDPSAMYDDVSQCVQGVHKSGQMYRHVVENLSKYLHKNVGLRQFLERLRAAGKTTFIITNSPYGFIKHGLEYMLGSTWRQLFDIVIVQARKPYFFQQNSRPFRQYHEASDRVLYAPVTELNSESVYVGGNISALNRMSSIGEKRVIYFGDHIGTDLTDLMLSVGWDTGCIVPELAREIVIQNSPDYRGNIRRMLMVKKMMRLYQDEARGDAEARKLLDAWENERVQLAYNTKSLFNAQFGSMFRTYYTATFFSRRLTRMADIYTARLPNLLKYSLDYKFLPMRSPLAHETHIEAPDVSEKYKNIEEY